MQSPKPRPRSLDVSQKKSPTATTRTARKLKTAETDPVPSPNPKIRTPKAQSPKVVADRRSPRTPINEKKRTGRTPEVASSQISQLQEELKKAKEELKASEALKKEAQDKADETKHQLKEINASEDSRIDELRKLSQERDKTWQSELEAMQRQHAMDSTALASAMCEVQKLKAQLSESESIEKLNETLSLVEELRGELYDAKEGEARAHEIVSATEKQLEIANLTLEMLRSDGMKMSEACNALTAELEQSKSEVKSLEKLLRQLEEEGDEDSSTVEELKEEINAARHEINQLKSAVEVTERRYQEEYVQSTLQIRSAYEREAELGEELKRTKAEREALHERLMDKEAKLRILADENELLNLKIKETEELNLEREVTGELKKLESDLVELRGNLMDKEMELQSVTSQNENHRSEMEKVQREKNKALDEALERLESLKEEADKSGKRAENATEQLGAAQVSKTELEAELRRLKVQCDQWRKAAEAAATMISDGNKNGNGKYVERTGSLESPLRRNMNMSPYVDETNDDDLSSPKKKNGSMLKKFGVLLKKSQK
ncbi:interactor of constitutive active ROPs 2, chloroplastic isoform X2 [Raphanus sativus]|uniref:Interactor of constitutive active ROPs 2, chloroplastic isoform X2 n=1 Tax=Raphanus sativus TaxID=3726 RepID=A0A6J0MYT9_RAPSA|nr:interactor of constitutive active ROPs 2, chloroplastic isoform X2 [Raphanus sativus]